VKPGEYVGIVGRSGCGKTTVLQLLLGMEKPERGTVFYDNYDVSTIDTKSLRRHLGVVTQDGKLFAGDIFNNITIASPKAGIEDAWEAAEIAGIADDIRKMPMGMQTIISEGSGGISGGQRQRLLIARAVCQKKKILLFDEATSALDNVTQKHVSDQLSKLSCEELALHFPEFPVGACRFPDCRHDKEPDCAVKNEVEKGRISASRYQSYLRMYRELKNPARQK
jgi:ABC-type bacteriocin/lantibiotic exporter with double-glycine peptidase domain